MGSTDPNRALLERRSRSARAPRAEPPSTNADGLGGLNKEMQPSPPPTLRALRICHRWARQNECKLTRGGACILIFFSLLGKVYSFPACKFYKMSPCVKSSLRSENIQKSLTAKAVRLFSEFSKLLTQGTPHHIQLRLQEKEY